MKKLLTAVACAAALCASGWAHAGVLTFNNPGLVDIDISDDATYTEGSFTISGQAASFLTLDGALVGSIVDTPFSLKTVDGGPFSLLAFDYAFYDLGFGDPPGTLSVVGLFDGQPVASAVFSLGALTNASFGSQWASLTKVTFTGTTGFSLDNISAVPEPGTLALAALGLMSVVVGGRKRQSVG